MVFESAHRVDEGARPEAGRTIEVKVGEKECGKESEELGVGGGHAVSSSEVVGWPGLFEETLERPVETFACELSDERVDECELATQQDDGDVGAEEKDGRERDEGEDLCERVRCIVLEGGMAGGQSVSRDVQRVGGWRRPTLDVGETERSIVARIDGACALGHLGERMVSSGDDGGGGGGGRR